MPPMSNMLFLGIHEKINQISNIQQQPDTTAN